MSERQLHLVRHGEVDNPAGLLYGRIPGYGLSALGRQMAALAAADLKARGRSYGTLLASPLQRAQESAQPIAEALGLAVGTEPRVIEPTNRFEGMQMHGPHAALRRPRNWRFLVNPFRPSWGEPYAAVVKRMRAAMDEAWHAARESDADIVIVSHQLPIVMVQRSVAGKPLIHDPRKRRCALSSISSFVRDERGRWSQVGYAEPADGLLRRAVDVGAV